MTAKKEQIEYALRELNIDAIQKTMSHLNIKWTDSSSEEKRVPSFDDVKNVARYCMEEAFKSIDKEFSIGGFEATIESGIVEIKFVLTKGSPLAYFFR